MDTIRNLWEMFSESEKFWRKFLIYHKKLFFRISQVGWRNFWNCIFKVFRTCPRFELVMDMSRHGHHQESLRNVFSEWQVLKKIFDLSQNVVLQNFSSLLKKFLKLHFLTPQDMSKIWTCDEHVLTSTPSGIFEKFLCEC